MNVLVWMHRDLRLHDQPALAAAAQAGPVLPLFIADSAEWQAPGASGRQWEFLAECLRFQREAFAGAGAPLAVRFGRSTEILGQLCRGHRIRRVFSTAEPGAGLRAAAGAAGAEWIVTGGESPDHGHDQGPDQGHSQNRQQVRPHDHQCPPALRPLPALPALQAISGAEPGPIPPARALRLAPDRCPNRQIGGDPAMLLAAAGAAQHKPGPLAPRTLAMMERAASRLSPYLAWGCLSEADLAAIPRLRAAQRRRAAALTAALAAADRDPDFPTYRGDSLHPGWRRGQTGLPFADACLRYLDAGGWLPAPLRAMLISLAVHHLGACPRLAAQAMAGLCTDHHPALLRHGVAEALRRTVDPVAMGRRLDPDGRFTRRWLPELAPVPDALLQSPWRWSGAAGLLGRRYPEPLVDPATALRNGVVARIRRCRAMAPRRMKAAPDQMQLPF